MGFWDDIKNEIFTEENKRKIGTFSRTAKEELSKLPMISAISDATQGASGLAEIQTRLKQDPNRPIHWLFYYEALMIHRNLKGGVSVARGIINPMGFIVGKGLATGLNAIDDQYQKFYPKSCLLMAISLITKKIEQKIATPVDIALYAKSQYYLANHKSETDKVYFLKQSIKNMSLAIKKETQQSLRAEFFFYLSQMYKTALRMELYYRSLNLSRKLGFLPAHKELADTLKKQETDSDHNNTAIDQLANRCPFQYFQYTYKPDLSTRVNNTIDHVLSEQSKKFADTSRRIGNFLSKL